MSRPTDKGVACADAAFDAVLGVEGAAPEERLTGLLFAAACWGRQHRASRPALHAWLDRCLDAAVDGLPDLRVDVVSPEELRAELAEAARKRSA